MMPYISHCQINSYGDDQIGNGFLKFALCHPLKCRHPSFIPYTNRSSRLTYMTSSSELISEYVDVSLRMHYHFQRVLEIENDHKSTFTETSGESLEIENLNKLAFLCEAVALMWDQHPQPLHQAFSFFCEFSVQWWFPALHKCRLL